MPIASNIAARKAATEVIELINAELRTLIDQHTIEAVSPFFATSRSAFGMNLTIIAEAPGPEPMTDAQAAHFGKQPMPWGQHKGTRVEDVPWDYLDWAASNEDTFKRDLNRYLLSRWARVNRESNQEDD